MNSHRYNDMSPAELQEYISALADSNAAGLSDEDINILQHVVHEKPELLGEYHLNIATKLCLLKHSRSIRCPETTSESIRSILYHVYKSRQATL
ncbi:MAG: hypothetical protein M5R41_16670 [Bacteroidia bacterium]|nr:hypothetical protein [Bacteroidia bacterium]